MTKEPDRTRTFWAVLALAGTALVAAHLATVGINIGMVQDRALLDTDAYTWMNRVIHIADTGEWFEHTYPRVNPPEGHQQHWTRPMDALLLAGGAVLSPLFGFDDGLYFWALLLTPLLHLLTLGALAWAARPLLRRSLMTLEGMGVLMLVFLVQVPVYLSFLVGRPDHHALLALLYVLYLGFWMRVLLDEEDEFGSAMGLGLVAALAMWVSVEALIFVALGMVGLGLSWLIGNLEMARRAAIHGAALLGGVVVGMIVEWGVQAPAIREMDALSVAHVGLMTLAAAFWLLLWGTGRTGVARGFRGRLGICAAGASAVLGLLYVAFPEFFASPFEGVDPLYAETRLDRIRELQPVSDMGQGFIGGLGSVILFLGPALVAVPYLAFRVVWARSRDEGIVWFVLALMLGLYVAMSLGEIRWTDYAALAGVIPFALLMIHVARIVVRKAGSRRVTLLRPTVLAGLLLGHVVVGGSLMVLGGGGGEGELPTRTEAWWGDSTVEPVVSLDVRDNMEGDEAPCDLVQVGEVLRDTRWFEDPDLVLAHTDHGPELLFRTHHDVLSIPNHRYQPGYRFTHEVMSHPDPVQAAAMLQERGVRILVLCRHDVLSGFFRHPEADAFAHWLADGGVPEGYALHAAGPGLRVYRSTN